MTLLIQYLYTLVSEELPFRRFSVKSVIEVGVSVLPAISF